MRIRAHITPLPLFQISGWMALAIHTPSLDCGAGDFNFSVRLEAHDGGAKPFTGGAPFRKPLPCIASLEPVARRQASQPAYK